jgi:hypothetical protein
MAQWCSHCAWAREGTGSQPSQEKTRAKTESKNQISIVFPELNWNCDGHGEEDGIICYAVIDEIGFILPIKN